MILIYVYTSCHAFLIPKNNFLYRKQLLLHMQAPSEEELEAYHATQWDSFKKNNLGHWIGVHAYHDPEEVDVADYSYCETKMDEKDDGSGSISQSTGFVRREIRADCEVCFDSSLLTMKEIAVHSKGKIRSRLCANVELLGPFPTRRGLSLEIGFRALETSETGDGRIRALIGMVPVDIDMADPNAPPSMFLQDIVVVRERLNRRPLDIPDDQEGERDIMWRNANEINEEQKEKVYSGIRRRCGPDGSFIEEAIKETTLKNIMNIDDEEDEDEDSHNIEKSINSRFQTGASGIDTSSDMSFKRIFPGGLIVHTPWVISSGVPTSVSMSVPYGNEVCVARVDFTPLIDADIQRGGMRVLPCTVTSFTVDELK